MKTHWETVNLLRCWKCATSCEAKDETQWWICETRRIFSFIERLSLKFFNYSVSLMKHRRPFFSFLIRASNYYLINYFKTSRKLQITTHNRLRYFRPKDPKLSTVLVLRHSRFHRPSVKSYSLKQITEIWISFFIHNKCLGYGSSKWIEWKYSSC